MKIDYEKFVNHAPTAVTWDYGGKKVREEFPFPITAVYSDKLKQVIVELFPLRKLRFINLDGSVASEPDIPALPGYEYRGLNSNKQAKTGVALLFNPVDENVGNEWRDIEQYELVTRGASLVGKKLGIYR
jgi:hypothetical protein